jgi:hypothetical protein
LRGECSRAGRQHNRVVKMESHSLLVYQLSCCPPLYTPRSYPYYVKMSDYIVNKESNKTVVDGILLLTYLLSVFATGCMHINPPSPRQPSKAQGQGEAIKKSCSCSSPLRRLPKNFQIIFDDHGDGSCKATRVVWNLFEQDRPEKETKIHPIHFIMAHIRYKDN